MSDHIERLNAVVIEGDDLWQEGDPSKPNSEEGMDLLCALEQPDPEYVEKRRRLEKMCIANKTITIKGPRRGYRSKLLVEAFFADVMSLPQHYPTRFFFVVNSVRTVEDKEREIQRSSQRLIDSNPDCADRIMCGLGRLFVCTGHDFIDKARIINFTLPKPLVVLYIDDWNHSSFDSKQELFVRDKLESRCIILCRRVVYNPFLM